MVLRGGLTQPNQRTGKRARGCISLITLGSSAGPANVRVGESANAPSIANPLIIRVPVISEHAYGFTLSQYLR
jgi:hypothetical protein